MPQHTPAVHCLYSNSSGSRIYPIRFYVVSPDHFDMSMLKVRLELRSGKSNLET